MEGLGEVKGKEEQGATVSIGYDIEIMNTELWLPTWGQRDVGRGRNKKRDLRVGGALAGKKGVDRRGRRAREGSGRQLHSLCTFSITLQPPKPLKLVIKEPLKDFFSKWILLILAFLCSFLCSSHLNCDSFIALLDKMLLQTVVCCSLPLYGYIRSLRLVNYLHTHHSYTTLPMI